jgi:hypothetical protein
MAKVISQGDIMFILFLVLAILSFLAVIGGVIWVVTTQGEWRTRRGEDVGAEIMDDHMRTEAHGATILYQKTAFKGKAVKKESEVTFSFAEIKALLAEGDWLAALPFILLLGGMMGLFLFGALAILFGGSQLVGLLFLAVAIYVIVRTGLSFLRA